MKYTKDERLDIGRRIYEGEMTRYQADEEQQKAAIHMAELMPSYPKEGYVKNTDGIIVVKLSE